MDCLPDATRRILELSGADVAELWVKEGSRKHFRCVVGGPSAASVGCALIPLPLGEEMPALTGEKGGKRLERLCCQVIRGAVNRSDPRVTDRGSYWTRRILDVPSSRKMARRVEGPRRRTAFEPYGSFALIPIRLEEECVGLLQLKSRKNGFFSLDDLVSYEDLSEVLGIALSYQYVEIELRERIKEMTCLYGLARVVAQEDASFEEVIQGIAELLPPAWLYPEIASARIVLDGRSYTTGNFRETPHRQVAQIVAGDKPVGFVEIAYLEERPVLDEGPFLTEERSLLNNVARKVAGFHERARVLEEKASLEDQLRHADRLATIGQLAAGVAHELNEPLGTILGFAQLAKKSSGVPARTARDLASIESASLHAREIIKKLMAFARQLPAKKEPVDLNDVVNGGLYFFEARCMKAGIHLVRSLAENLPAITVDPGQMNQVLVNLVVNSIQAMPEGGTLTVETYAGEGSVFLAVEDTGVGMSDAVRRQIFLPFFTTKDISEGTGLGLAVAHGIVTSHRGTITVRSEPGKGARFLIRLPLDSSARGE